MNGPAEYWKLEIDAISAVRRHKPVFWLHVAGNILLPALFYGWLWIPDSNGFYLMLSLLGGLVLAATALWLHSGTFAYFRRVHRREQTTLDEALRSTLPRLPSLAGACVILYFAFVVLLVFLLFWGLLAELAVDWVASALSMGLGMPVSLDFLHYAGTVWLMPLLTDILLPLAVLPFLALATSEGLRGLRRPGRRQARQAWRQRHYWLSGVILLLLIRYVPQGVVDWAPEFGGLALEAISMAVRFSLAYLLFVALWLTLISILGRATAASPDVVSISGASGTAPSSAVFSDSGE